MKHVEEQYVHVARKWIKSLMWLAFIFGMQTMSIIYLLIKFIQNGISIFGIYIILAWLIFVLINLDWFKKNLSTIPVIKTYKSYDQVTIETTMLEKMTTFEKACVLVGFQTALEKPINKVFFQNNYEKSFAYLIYNKKTISQHMEQSLYAIQKFEATQTTSQVKEDTQC